MGYQCFWSDAVKSVTYDRSKDVEYAISVTFVKHMVVLGRYDDMVFEAVIGLKEPHGSSNASITSYIEVMWEYWSWTAC